MAIESATAAAAISDFEPVRARARRAGRSDAAPEAGRASEHGSPARSHHPPGHMRRELAHHAQEVRQAIRELVKQPELEPSARRTVRDLERAFHDALRDAFRSAREADGDRAAVLIEGVGGATDALAEGLRSALGVAPPAAAVPDVDPQTSRIDRVA